MRNLAGIKDMNGLPDMLFIIDVRKEDIAVAEAGRLNIPIVAVVDTNCSPEGITQVIPGNDDALRAIRLFASRIADAILEGQQVATEGSVAASGQTTDETDDSTQSDDILDSSVVGDQTSKTIGEGGASDDQDVPDKSGKAFVGAASSEDITGASAEKGPETNEATAS
jgi:small subunit ribosomal protein S2